ncbi:MAG: ATP-binding cassette domain-containing protein [Petrimonas sp.]|jgi:ABC-2 type transport system ATP-binding protein
MITIQNLSFKYGKKEILSDISMTLEAGKIYGLLGENGVGKTTLLKIICGLQKPFAGSCTVQGENPFNRTPSFLSSLYYLPEDLEYIQLDMSITQFSKLNAPFYPKFDYEKFEIILKEFDVNGDKKLNKLSHGQTKKAAIAFALATNVDLLLMDEPSNGLDIPSKTLFRRIIVEYVSDNTCTIISTHQVRDLENLIDPIIILDNKAVLMNASLEKISEKLYFRLYSSVPANALYFEPAPGGYICVMENEDMGESKINIEALFNATMQHKSRIQQLLA